MAGIKKLLFVDTNIWLDFYRSRKSDAAMELLEKLEEIKDRIIVTFVLEMEYKKNRQDAIADGMKELVAPAPVATHGIFSQAKPAKTIEKSQKQIVQRLAKLKKRLENALADPIHHDPVYQTCQRIFRRKHSLVLSVESDKRLKAQIRAKAVRRFYLGCPPRKKGDTSIGDAVNWEWMIHCAQESDAELVILTRDSDFGRTLGQKIYLNDHLKQEFQDRVSKKRKVLLYSSAVQALKHFEVKVSKETEKSEAEREIAPESDHPILYDPSIGLGEMFANSAARNQELLVRLRQLLTIKPSTAILQIQATQPTEAISPDPNANKDGN